MKSKSFRNIYLFFLVFFFLPAAGFSSALMLFLTGLFFCTVLHLGPLFSIKNLFTKSDGQRCDLNKLIISDKLQALLKAHSDVRNQLQRLIGARSTHVGDMLRLADINGDVLVS